MEQSGKPSERESDHKVDFNIQCDINPNELVKQLQIDLCLVKEELVELKTEKKQLKAHNARKQAGYEADYQEILIEKQRISVEMVKLQSQNDLLIEKVTVVESKAEAEQVDECVQVFRCEGNCDHVGCISEALRLRNMKNQGSRRTSPVVEAVSVKQFRCPQCNFKCEQENMLHDHVKKEHREFPSCPFCLVGLTNQASLKRHVELYHNENTPISRERGLSGGHQVKRGPCIFFQQPRGCKKGSDCDFSHERGVQYNTVKVRKLCRNGPGCTWKPRCRYVHMEDGEVIPPRFQKEVARVRIPGEERTLQREEPRPGFGTPNLSQPPPTFTMRNYPVL